MAPAARSLDRSGSGMAHALVCSVSLRRSSSIHGRLEPGPSSCHRLPWSPRTPTAGSRLHRHYYTDHARRPRASARLRPGSLCARCSFGSVTVRIRAACTNEHACSLSYDHIAELGSGCFHRRHEQFHPQQRRYGLDFQLGCIHAYVFKYEFFVILFSFFFFFHYHR